MPASEPAASPSSMAKWLFFIAFAIIFVGMILMTIGSLNNTGWAGGGAVILIGPIPIIIGAGPYSIVAIGLAAVLTILAIVYYLLLRKRTER